MGKYVWNGRIIVDQRDRARGVAGMVSSCIDYYEEHDGWQHCLMTGNGGTSNEKWVWCYEILKTGTMKISCWLDKSDAQPTHTKLPQSGKEKK